MKDSVERVLVVPTELFRQVGSFQGFCPEADRYLSRLLQPEVLRFLPRDQAETDPSFKQLIPYVLFRWKGQLFHYARGGGHSEQRLHRKRSVGVGGHICSADGQADEDCYNTGLARELAEEVQIDTPYQAHCLGLINDDQTEVGRVHLGVAHLYEVERPAVQPRELDLLEAGFAPQSSLLAELSSFETWSQICLGYLCDQGR